MGTNYYIQFPECPTCKHAPERKHIGKSSAGWYFSLHVYPEKGIKELDDWLPLFLKEKIVDEYGKPINIVEMLGVILFRYRPGPEPQPTWDNSIEAGNHGLVRSPIDGKRCIGHGKNNLPYELCVGEFS